MGKRAVVIGAGFAGLSVASFLAKWGFQVTVLEKNDSSGGRARRFASEGFTFDMGPSWYWMPDVFEHFFNQFGFSTADFYSLRRLDPSYRIYFGNADFLDIPADFNELKLLFESLEAGSGQRLETFLDQAAYKYKVGINKLVYYPSRSLLEFMNPTLLIDVIRLDVFQSMAKHVRKYFSNERLLQLVEFPLLFLGAVPANTPALYSLMNHADMRLGTWYPEEGMYSVVKAMEKVARSLGVEFHFNSAVKEFKISGSNIKEVLTQDTSFPADLFVSGADYHHTETLLPAKYQSYTSDYWNKRTLAPSSLIFYLGIDRKLQHLLHHTLFFDQPFEQHAIEIYEHPKWPTKPLFYLSVPSVTDSKVAPPGKENMFILVPVAPGLPDTDETREHYFHLIMDRLESLTDQKIRQHIIYKRSYAHRDFISDYHAFKGNAYGLANTLRQTAILKPSLKSKKIRNLFYTGQLTVPGPGVPPSLISGEVVAGEVKKEFGK